MASGHTGNVVPRKGLRVRVPCPPLCYKTSPCRELRGLLLQEGVGKSRSFRGSCSLNVANSSSPRRKTPTDNDGRWLTDKVDG